MVHPNYFEVLGLDSEARVASFGEKIEEKKKRLEIDRATQRKTREELENERQEIAAIEEWKNNIELIKLHRAEFIAAQQEKVRLLVRMLPNGYMVTSRVLIELKKAYRLNQYEITKVFGEDPDHRVLLVTAPRFPEGFFDLGAKVTRDRIKRFKEHPFFRFLGPWLDDVADLYSLLAGLGRIPVEAARTMDSPSLLSIAKNNFDMIIPFAEKQNSNAAGIAREIYTSIRIVFGEDKSKREAYNHSLLYESLEPLFIKLREIPIELRKEPSVTRYFINQIMQVFPDQDLANTIFYNEARL